MVVGGLDKLSLIDSCEYKVPFQEIRVVIDYKEQSKYSCNFVIINYNTYL